MREVTPEPLTAEAFAPFGDVIEASPQAEQIAINYGQTTRFNDLARIDVVGGHAIVSIFRGRPLNPPHLTIFERHPLGSQSFTPLQGRAFLHSYDWTTDEGFATLDLILTAPVVVASWISLQYYGSTVAPQVFGGGNKLIHNVVGGFGVVEGNGGLLRPGLPFQTLHDGAHPAHEALRLSVMIEAPVQAITDALRKHEGVRALFDNGWLHLFALENGRITARYRPGLVWEAPRTAVGLAA